MAKKYQAPKHVHPVEDVIEQPPKAVEAPKPRVTSFVPRQCTACTELRKDEPEASYSRVYATVGKTRYCKCSFCGATWKQID